MTEIWDYQLTTGKGGRCLFRQCEAVDFVPCHYPRLGVETIRCGADAIRGVSWERPDDPGYRHSLLVCDRHTLRYAAPTVG